MNLPGLSPLQRIYNNFSPAEFLFFAVLSVVFLASTIGLLWQLQIRVSTETPASGGTLQVGVVGSPQYLNPVLATSAADKDISALVFSGLTQLNSTGEITLDLASGAEISEDGTRYTFTISDNAQFSDGSPVTAADVLFTIEMIQDQRITSPQAADWSGVTVEAVDNETVVFQLDEPFAGFILNTTMGILPAHYWQNVSPQAFAFSNQNSDPVGAGDFEVRKIVRGEDSVIDSVELIRRSNNDDGYIDEMDFSFYGNQSELEEALKGGVIDSAYNINPKQAAAFSKDANFRVNTAPLNRIFAVFFNQNDNPNLANSDIRKALGSVIDKRALVEDALYGYGTPVSGPLPASMRTQAQNKPQGTTTSDMKAEALADKVEAATQALASLGWEKNADGLLVDGDGEAFDITLTTAKLPALEKSAEMVAKAWRQLGIAVTVQAVTSAELAGEVIRPRNYEALLFGQSVSRSGDLYPFWHSSAGSDPGLNLAMYANSDIDEKLSQLRETRRADTRATLKDEITTTIRAETPALFLYTPDFIQVTRKNLRGVTLPAITSPNERFASLDGWYTKTRRLWNIFRGTRENQEDDEARSLDSTSSTTAQGFPEISASGS